MINKNTIFTLIFILLLVLNVIANNSPTRSPTNNILQSPNTSPISPINFDTLNTIAQDCESRVKEVEHDNQKWRIRQATFNRQMENAHNGTKPLDQEELTTRQNDRILNPELMQKLIKNTAVDTKIQNADINQLVHIMLESESKIHDIITKLANKNNTCQNGNTNHTVVGDVHSNISAKRLLENMKLIETKDQSTSTEDLFVLDDGLPAWDHQISTTVNHAANTERLLENDNTKRESLNLNEINNINEQIAIQAHQSKVHLDTTRTNSIIPHKAINNRLLNNILMPIAVAGGQNEQGRTGIWTSSSYSIAKQGSLSNHLPYKSIMSTLTIGGDMEIGDSTILGGAYSNAHANLKFHSLGSNSRINSNIFSVYSQHALRNNLSLQLLASSGLSTIKSKVREHHKKSYGDNISIESNLIYCHVFSNNIQFLPTIGLKFNCLHGGYDKGNNKPSQITINYTHERILSSHFGARMILRSIDISSKLQLTPTMQASLERGMANGHKILMASTTQGEGGGVDVHVELPRVIRNTYNLGASLIAQKKNITLQLDYHYSMQKSYKAHTVMMKVIYFI